MPGIHRLKRNFTAGELSPLLNARIDNARYKNGCHKLLNMHVKPQGPATRRSGFQFIHDITPLLFNEEIPTEAPRLVTFEFNEIESYAMLFYKYNTVTRFLVGYDEGVVEASPGVPFVYEITGVFDIDNFTYAQSGDIMFVCQSGRIVLEIQRVDRNNWTVVEGSFTNTPTEWNATDGYPELVSFYEQRIVFAANNKRPQTLWFSASGDFSNMGDVDPQTPGPADGFAITLDSGKLNKIMWLSSTRNLLAGTLGAEWSLFGGGYEPISFENPRAIRHTNNGSERLETLMIGPVTLFLERYGTTVSQLVYEFNSDSYDAVDLSILAPHLTDDYTIISWCYQQKPNGIVWCVREDGKLIALTFKREHKVTGWHIHETDGKFLSVCAVPGKKQDDVWALVERTIGGTAKWFLEKQRPEFKGTDLSVAMFSDSHIYQEFAEPITEITSGLEHLEGETVTALADGAVVPDQVVSGGGITLQMPASRVCVGLPFTSELHPTLDDLELTDGTTLGRVQRIARLDILLYNSLGFEYGFMDEEGYEEWEEEPFRVPTDLTGQAVPIFNGVKRVDLPSDYSEDFRIMIRQEQPLPLTVLGLIDIGEVDK